MDTIDTRRSSTEAQRASTFLDRAKQSKYKNGGNRFDARREVKTQPGGTSWVEQDINMLFKTGDYLFTVPVRGKTNNYDVTIRLVKFLDKLNDELKRSPFNIPTFQRTLTNAVNSTDMKISCQCADWIYRGSYTNTLNDDNAGRPETRPAVKTNPENKPYVCKHIAFVLSNKLWATKVARNLFNYIVKLWNSKRKLFDAIIRPALNNITDEKILGQPEKKEPSNFTRSIDTVNQAAADSQPTLATEALYGYYSDRTEFDDDQNFALSVCKDSGTDVTPYVTPETTPEAILSLGEAMEAGLPDEYLRALGQEGIRFTVIDIIVQAYKARVDLFKYRTLTAEVLEQVLRGVLLGVPLQKIALAGFNSRQIEQLVRAYKISPALYDKICNPNINYNKMRDIIAGRATK